MKQNTDKQPIVSITMSTYNVQSYLRDCMECVINQTMSNVEIICIDDGSTDDTSKILKEYAANDTRVKIILKEKNEGLAVSRNEALHLAKGKYIGFVDGDDLLNKDLFRQAVELAEKEKSDMVLWDYVVFSNTDELKKEPIKPSELVDVSKNNKLSLLQRPAFAWTKLIKTNLAGKLNLHFPEGCTRQDIPVHWKLITNINYISILPKRLYYYRQQSGATTFARDKRLLDLPKVMDIVKQQLIEDNLFETYKSEYLRQKLARLYGMIDHIDKKYYEEAMKMFWERMGKEELEYLKNKPELKWQIMDFYKSLDGSIFAKIRRKLWLGLRTAYRSIK